MDLGIIAALVMLIIWVIGTVLQGPGWIHALLSVGVFLLIYRIVLRETADPPPRQPKR